MLFFAVALPLTAQIPSFRVMGTDAAPWTRIFGSVNVADRRKCCRSFNYRGRAQS